MEIKNNELVNSILKIHIKKKIYVLPNFLKMLKYGKTALHIQEEFLPKKLKYNEKPAGMTWLQMIQYYILVMSNDRTNEVC